MTDLREELRQLFLFEAFTDEQLGWVVERGEVVTHAGGSRVFDIGEPSEWLYVLLDGRIQMDRQLAGEDVAITTTDHPGSYMGAVRAYVEDRAATYETRVTAVEPSRLFRLAADDFAELMHRWFPMAVHLLDGLYNGIRRSEQRLREREKLLALGSLSAKLTHELNNPAAAATRSAGQLRHRVGTLRHKLAGLAEGHIEPARLRAIVRRSEEAVELAAKAPRRSAVEEATAEDAVLDWLDDRDVPQSWELAPVFVAAGLGTAWMDEIAAEASADELPKVLQWLAGQLEIESLLDEVEQATGRISALVGAARQYSNVDRAPLADVDLRDGLESTITLLGHRMATITVVRDYAEDLPPVPVRPAELNQVWTNLLVNAADALDGTGTITVRTRREDDQAVVEIADDGPGIPDDVLPHIFEPFFTTKPSGGGTGVGLEISKRIVEEVHGGALTVRTGPAETCFQIRLPVT